MVFSLPRGAVLQRDMTAMCGVLLTCQIADIASFSRNILSLVDSTYIVMLIEKARCFMIVTAVHRCSIPECI